MDTLKNKVGRKRSVERQSLDKANLLELIKFSSLQEIAEIYGVDIKAVSLQLTFVMNQKTIGFKNQDINFQSEEALISLRRYGKEDDWKDSQARLYMVENKFMEFQQEN